MLYLYTGAGRPMALVLRAASEELKKIFDPYLVVPHGEPQCLNNVQGANCIEQSLTKTSKGEVIHSIFHIASA